MTLLFNIILSVSIVSYKRNLFNKFDKSPNC